jgi:uncharacterized membrane protein YraQ (UPF0718 family)
MNNFARKMVSITKKNKLILLVALIYLILLILSPSMAGKAVQNSLYYLVEMFQVIPVIFLLTVVIEALVPKELIVRGFGEKSGMKGNILALLLGSISAGPIYAAFPVSKTLLGKGASITNIVIILSAWAVIKLPMLANEAKFLGVNFMVVRWILTVISILIMAYIIGRIIKKKDIPQDAEPKPLLSVNADYCIGCGLCVKLSPSFFEMKDQKAIVRTNLSNQIEYQSLKPAIEKCPSKAIQFVEIDPSEKLDHLEKKE